MKIQIDRNSKTPMYLQICNQVQNMIQTGILTDGFKLPPERKLAEQLNINRTTVLTAYRELKAMEVIESHVGKGTIVTNATKNRIHNSNLKPMYSHLLKNFGKENNVTQEILELANKDNMISFAAGVANPDIHSCSIIKDVQDELYETYESKLFNHTPVDGINLLKEEIIKLNMEKDIYSSTSEVMIISGAQQGISLFTKALITKGDIIVVEDPTFFNAKQTFEMYGATVIGVPVDDKGIRLDVLEFVLKKNSVKFIYVIPDFQNPTGNIMPSSNKEKLVELAEKYQTLILEDCAYGELYYDDYVPIPIKAFDKKGYVTFLGTFSKVLFMGLRLGWVTAPKEVINAMSKIKLLDDLHTCSLSQWIFYSLLKKGLYKNIREEAIKENKKKLKKMLEALNKNKNTELDVSWNDPKGGLYIWVKVPENINTDMLFKLAVKKGIVFVPGNVFSVNLEFSHFLRLNFSYVNIDKIDKGISILYECINEQIKNENYQNEQKELSYII